jgi:hypothetical protein
VYLLVQLVGIYKLPQSLLRKYFLSRRERSVSKHCLLVAAVAVLTMAAAVVLAVQPF